MRLVERFTRVSATRSATRPPSPTRRRGRPLDRRVPAHRDPEYVMSEYACHEGNLGLRNSLSGSRSDEAKGMGK